MGVQQLHFILKVSKNKVKVIGDIPKKKVSNLLELMSEISDSDTDFRVVRV